MPRVVKANFLSIGLTFVVSDVLYSLLRSDDYCETSKVTKVVVFVVA